MSVFDSKKQSPRSALHALAAVGGVLIGFFLLAGAYGHYAAVGPVLDGAADPLPNDRFGLLLPVLMLALPGVIDIGVCRAVWAGKQWSLNLAAAANFSAAIYLAYQMLRGIPGHPIGLFLALVSSYTLVLAAIRMGLEWPASTDQSEIT